MIRIPIRIRITCYLFLLFHSEVLEKGMGIGYDQNTSPGAGLCPAV